jgi:hypothetical protein
MARHNLDPWVCRRVSSWTKYWHYLLASFHRRFTSATPLDTSKKFASVASQA